MINHPELVTALVADYLNVFIVEPQKNTADIVKLDGYVTDGITEKPKGFCYTDMLGVYANNRVLPEDREYFLSTLAPSALVDAFADGQSKHEMSYRVLDGGEVHYYLARYSRLSGPNEELRLVAGFRNVDEIHQRQLESRNSGLLSAYTALSNVYLSMYRVDLQKNTFAVIKNNEAVLRYTVKGSDNYDENLRSILNGLSAEQSNDKILSFCSRENLAEKLQSSAELSIEFMSKASGLCRIRFFKEDEDAGGRPWHIIFAVEAADVNKSYSVFEALTHNYRNVFLINLADGTSNVLKLGSRLAGKFEPNVGDTFLYEALSQRYISECVHPKDVEMMRRDISLANLRKVFENQTEHVGSYRISVGGKTHFYQYRFFRLVGGGFVVAAFQNVDEIVEKQRALEEKQRQKELEFSKKLQEQLAIFDALARNFKNVYLVNIIKGTAKVLKLDDEHSGNRLDDLMDVEFPYDAFLRAWIGEAVHPDDREMLAGALCPEHLREVFASESEYIGNYRMSVDGRILNYQFNLSQTSEKGLIIAGFQNIDGIINAHLEEEKKQRQKEQVYQKQLIAAANAAKSANKAKTEFLLRMSHDIRTPLNGIVGMVEIAERFSGNIEKQSECRAKVKESAGVLPELINEVLDMSKLESGDVVLEHVPFSLEDISREIYTIISKQAEQNDIELIEDCNNVEHRRLVGSPIHYKRLLMNIVGNAVKYNKEHGKIFITMKELGCDGKTVAIEFRCRDTGIGMSPEFVRHIFEPFSQESTTPHSKFGGTGLGMSIAKNLAEKMGGGISVESIKGEGSTFKVIIPFEIDTSAGAEEAADGEKANYSIEGFRIILAEDNDLNMEIGKFLLEDAGAEVIEAHNGREAVEAFEHSRPYSVDAVLMDVMMPVMDGYSATRKIRSLERADAKRIPIIAMTANAFAEDKISSRKAGMNEHLAKPLDTVAVIRTVAELVEKYRKG